MLAFLLKYNYEYVRNLMDGMGGYEAYRSISFEAAAFAAEPGVVAAYLLWTQLGFLPQDDSAAKPVLYLGFIGSGSIDHFAYFLPWRIDEASSFGPPPGSQTIFYYSYYPPAQ